MNTKWPTVRLGELLRRSEETLALLPDIEYREITVKLWGKGVVLRRVVTGSEVAGQHRYVARAGQFILSRIDARNGALGIVPEKLDGAIVTNDFPVFNLDSHRLLSSYLGWMCQTATFVEHCHRVSEGTTNRVRLQEGRFCATEIKLPPLAEQQRLVARIDELAAQVREARTARQQAVEEAEALIATKLWATIQGCGTEVRYLPFTDLARLERRPVTVQPHQQYQEIGVYSFGKGIFHKTPRTGAEVGDKDLYQIRAGDFILQITFAWEGAVALAEQSDHGLYGSVRYLTFRVNEGICSPRYLLAYMKMPEAITQLGTISPGSAGRNRVLSVKRLREVMVPVVPLEYQGWMTEALKAELDALKRLQAETAAELDALLPSILDRAFKGEL